MRAGAQEAMVRGGPTALSAVQDRSYGEVVDTGLAKLVKYSAVSVMSVVITQSLLQLALFVGMPAVAANILAVGLSALPAYLVNRRWVWRKQGAHSVAREIVPFWSYAFLGLAISTVAVAWADHRWHTALAVSLANIASFGVLWIAKFVLLDRWMFGGNTERAEAG